MRHQLIFVIAQNAKLLGFVGAGGRQERAHRMGLFQHTHTEAKPSQALYWGSGQRGHRRSPWVAQMTTTRGWRSRALQVGRRLWARPKETHPRWVVGLGSGLRRIENATFKKWLFLSIRPLCLRRRGDTTVPSLGGSFSVSKTKTRREIARPLGPKLAKNREFSPFSKHFWHPQTQSGSPPQNHQPADAQRWNGRHPPQPPGDAPAHHICLPQHSLHRVRTSG